MFRVAAAKSFGTTANRGIRTKTEVVLTVRGHPYRNVKLAPGVLQTKTMVLQRQFSSALDTQAKYTLGGWVVMYSSLGNTILWTMYRSILDYNLACKVGTKEDSKDSDSFVQDIIQSKLAICGLGQASGCFSMGGGVMLAHVGAPKWVLLPGTAAQVLAFSFLGSCFVYESIVAKGIISGSSNADRKSEDDGAEVHEEKKTLGGWFG